MKLKQFLIVPLLLIGLLFCGCAVNPVTGEKQLMLVSESQELQLGRQYAPEVEKQMGGRINNSILQNYINNVGQKIAQVSHRPDLNFRYVALDDDSINAVALPGGYVFIARGMLEKLNSEAQLAAVLAHETVHVTARHSAASMSNQIGMDILLSAVISEKTSQGITTIGQLTSQLISLGHSREHEMQADSFGLDYLAKAGYDPYAMIEMMEMLRQQNTRRPFKYFSTHPDPAARKAALQNQINSRNYRPGLKIAAADYKKFVLANLN